MAPVGIERACHPGLASVQSTSGVSVRTLGNIIWLALAGIWLAIGYLLAGIINCLFIITIPFRDPVVQTSRATRCGRSVVSSFIELGVMSGSPHSGM